jgi:hypothetical protein
MSERIIEVLMDRDGMDRAEAISTINECRDELMQRLGDGEMPYDICDEYFGLEPDYLEDLI